MKVKNILLICSIILLFSIASVTASDADDTVIANEESDLIEITDQDIEEIQNDEQLGADEPGTFTDLNTTINGNADSEVYLNNNYTYSADTAFKSGIKISRDVTINGNGHTIDAKNTARMFLIEDNVNAIFKNIIFTNGYTKSTSQYSVDSGGAIRGKCTVINCTFTSNTAEIGGAIRGEGSTAINCTFKNNKATHSYGGATYGVTAINCTFADNTAKKSGGAMYQGSAENCNFTNNNAQGTTDKDKDGGGAMYGGRAVNCIFTKNRSSYYGGAILGSATNCTFTENIATNYGGGISYGNAENCTFTKNNAKFGGAIYWGSAKNCNFTENSATGTSWTSGGAISLPYVEGYVINCSFKNNWATYQGGAIYHGSSEGNITVANCTFSNNRAQNGGASYMTSAINCTFINNKATAKESGTGYGGAMCGWSNTYHAINCTFINNSATNQGGAAQYEDCENCTFINNTAKIGGALYRGSAVDCEFINNSASEQGGAMYDATYDNCTFENNKVGDEINNIYFNPTLIYDYFYEAQYNTAQILNATYIGTEGKPVNGVNVTVEIRNNTYDLIGTYHFLTGEGLLLPNLDFGEYSGTIYIEDPAYGYPYKDGFAINIMKATDRINAPYTGAVYNDNKYFIITLTDGNGKPISDAELSIDLNGVKNLKTDANGQIKISTKGLIPKTYSVTITFDGGNNYYKNTKTATVKITKAKAKITAKKKTFKKSLKVKKYTITLKSGKTAIKKVKVYIKIKGKTYKATTNKKGKATFKIKKLTKKGTFKSKITFKGNKYYKKATKTIKIKIK